MNERWPPVRPEGEAAPREEASGYFHGLDVAVRRAGELDDPELLPADETLLETLRDETLPSIALLAEACRVYADRPCFGERIDEDGALLPRYHTLTFSALWTRVQALATGWTSSGLVRAGDFVGICGFASIDFVVADLACLYVGAVSVPLQTAVSAADLRHIVAESGMRTLVCSAAHAHVAESAHALGVPHVVLMDGPRGLREMGSTAAPVAMIAPDLDRLVSVLYTSGTTGSPKGVMYLDRIWARRMRYTLREAPIPIVTVGCMPLNHVMGRFTAYRVMMRGGVTCFVARADMSTLFDDIRLVRPTVMTLVPRATSALYQHFQTEVVRRGGDADGVMAEMSRTFLGDRLCLVMTGSAATPPEVVTFLERCFRISVLQFYGFNEFGQVSANEHVEPDVEYRLLDVPELGYSVLDEPYPRGELIVRGRHASPGYFKHGDLDRHLRDAEGFVHSGDIMEERAPGHLVWIDRRNNVIKLSQGEFVSLTRLEELFVAQSPHIAQLHLHGSSKRAYLLAVVVPAASSLDDDALRKLLRAELDRIAAANALPSHEVPRAFLVEKTAFSKENGLLTESSKPKRSALAARFGEPLEALYAVIEARQLVDAGGDDATSKILAALSATLGTNELDLSRSFIALGGDSFSAVRLSELLRRSFGFSPPVGALLDPASTLGALVTSLEGGAAGSGLFAEIHGSGVHAADLRLARFLPPELLRRIPAPRAPHAVLLTGANGFLGRFLLLELLEKVDVVCVVRGSSDEAARTRLLEGFGPSLRPRLDALASRLRVVAGDLMRPRFGVDDSTWRMLCDLDAIVHNGALVNHALPYAELFEPNVLGTVEVMRLALEGRPKSIAFVSSSGVAAGTGRSDAIREDEAASKLWPSRALADGHASGYSTSKWAAEVLLAELAGTCGVPVQVLRCGMILPHRHVVGAVNDGDNIVRLLRGLVATGIAPRSFYRDDVPSKHFDGIAVDVVAQAIAAIALEAEPGHHTYHVSNAHWDDGVSLDDLARAVAEVRPLELIEDYDAWFAELRVRLEALDEPTRKRSPLPIIGRWAHAAGPDAAIRLDTTRFSAKLRALGLGEIPSLDAGYLRHVVRSI